MTYSYLARHYPQLSFKRAQVSIYEIPVEYPDSNLLIVYPKDFLSTVFSSWKTGKDEQMST